MKNTDTNAGGRPPASAGLRRWRAASGPLRWQVWTVLALVGLAAIPVSLQAQYFGRNKAQYEEFDFRVLKTDHFDIHFYPEEEQAVRDAARMAERWYTRLSRLFGHQIGRRTPMILYANQGDFQQTNVISDLISEGTGGFTEPLKDRVVLPLTGNYQGNDHVIGHELVHSFQYDIAASISLGSGTTVGGGSSSGLDAMGQLPLWFIEGMAEYLSIGRDDPNTATWMREVVLNDRVPSIDDVTSDMRYFPYRYGQAIWAYIAGRWGDDIIPRLYRAGLQSGFEPGVQRILGISVDSLSNDWIASLKAAYAPVLAGRTAPATLGERVLAEDIDAGDMNISPAISPDGRYVAFLSSRDIFTTDLFLADARTGEVLDQLLSADANPHLDALRFISSAGSWSPDGRRFATVVYSEGNDELAIIDVASRDIVQQIPVPGVGAISNPSWSPDGAQVIFSGSRGGISDLYVIELSSRRVQQLTSDRYGDMQPVYSPDGKTIAFASDRGNGTSFDNLTYAPMGISLYDMASGKVTNLPLFASGRAINPQYSPDGNYIYFISDQDGFSDVYRYGVKGGDLHRVTEVATGVAGITELSPAITVARDNGRLMFSVFDRGSYTIHALEADASRGTAVANADNSASVAGILPPVEARGRVAEYMADAATGLPSEAGFDTVAYTPSLKLDYLGVPMLGVSFGGYGTGFAGAVAGYFSDMLGYHQLGVTLQMNGGLEDIGGEAMYIYNRGRWGWGVGVAHIPYVATAAATGSTTIEIDGQPVEAPYIDQYFERVFVDRLQLIGQYPFSTTRRFEITTGYTRQSYSRDVFRQYVINGLVAKEEEFELGSPDALNLLQASTAFVGDNSYFGFTSPVAGERFRAEIGGTAGSLRFATLLLDYRRYFFANPVTFAVRGLHYGRYGNDGESDQLSELFIGYEDFVRGYSPGSFDLAECSNGGAGGICPEFDRLLGSRVGLVSAEVRVPLFGTSQFGLINFPFLPTELSAFVDGGVAWTKDQAPVFEFSRTSSDRIPVFSAGVSARVNVLGYVVAEFFYAYPFQRPGSGWQFGFQLAPGW